MSPSWLLVFNLIMAISVKMMAETVSDTGRESDPDLCSPGNEDLCDHKFYGSLAVVTAAERRDCRFLMERLQCLRMVSSKCPEESKGRHPAMSEVMGEMDKTYSECMGQMEQADAAVGGESTEGQISCQGSEVEECLHSVYPFMKNETLSGLSVDRAERELACSVFKQGMSCIDDYATRCLTPHQRETLERRVWGARQVMIFICSAKMYEGHRQYSECFRVLSSKISNCSNSLQRTRLRRPYHNKEESIKDLCCAQKNFLGCMLKDAYKVCEDSAIDLAAKIFKSMYTPQLNQKCSTLKALECSGCHKGYPLMSVLLILLWVLHLL